MFHVKHHRARGRTPILRRRRRTAVLRKNVSRETSRGGSRNIRFCKTTPCIKKSPFLINDMTLRTFGTSEPSERPLSRPQRARARGERRCRQRPFKKRRGHGAAICG